MAASITKEELVEALEELLPPLDPEIVTFGIVLEKLAARFSVGQEELKKAHKSELKLLIADMSHLCEGGDNKENEGGSDENASDGSEEEEPVKRKRKTAVKRSRAIRDSDEEADSDENDSEEDDHSEVADDDDSEDEKPKRRKKTAAPAKKQKTAAKTSVAKRKTPAATKAADSEGVAALKELARVAGLMGPAIYSLLKKAGSEEAQEAILRERLDEGGVRFSGAYPKKSDITAAKKKKEKERELDGIDTSLIISGGRPRRGAAQRASYVEKYEDEEEDEELEKGEGQEENGDAGQEDEDEESEAHVESDASDESEAEF